MATAAWKVEKPTLLDKPLSPFGGRVRYLIYKEGLASSIDIQSPDLLGGPKSDQYFQEHVAGKFPLLLLPDGQSIPESAVISEYVMEKWGLWEQYMQQTPEDRAAVRTLVHILDMYLAPAMPCMYKPMGTAERAAKLAEVKRILDHLESKCVGPMLTGDKMTAADVAAFPLFTFITFMLPQFFGWSSTFEGRPKLEAWWGRVKTLPAADKVVNEIVGALEAWKEAGRWDACGVNEDDKSKKLVVLPIESRTKNALLTRLDEQLGWVPAGGYAVVEELERFLTLKAHQQDYYNQALAPSGMQYAFNLPNLQTLGGPAMVYPKSHQSRLRDALFIHYDAHPTVDHAARYTRTLQLYKEKFGSVPHSVWRHADESKEDESTAAARLNLVTSGDITQPGPKRRRTESQKAADSGTPPVTSESNGQQPAHTGVVKISDSAKQRIISGVPALHAIIKTRPSHVDFAIQELERFLALKAHHEDTLGEKLAPSPANNGQAPNHDSQIAAYRNTQKHYKEKYGVDPPHYSSGRIPRIQVWQHASKEASKEFSIRVKTLQGKLVLIDALAEWHTIAHVKAQVAKIEKIPIEQQHMMNPLGGIHMYNDDTLGCHDLGSKSVVYLVKK